MAAGGEGAGWLALGVFVAALAIGIVRSYNPGYRFDGMIGQEHVIFREDIFGGNYLEVTKANGIKVTYFDTIDNDFILEGVTEGGRTYTSPANLPARFQTEFNSYLEIILEEKAAQ
jgi:hypothetical protein